MVVVRHRSSSFGEALKINETHPAKYCLSQKFRVPSSILGPKPIAKLRIRPARAGQATQPDPAQFVLSARILISSGVAQGLAFGAPNPEDRGLIPCRLEISLRAEARLEKRTRPTPTHAKRVSAEFVHLSATASEIFLRSE